MIGTVIKETGCVILIDDDPSVRRAMSNLMASAGLDFHACAVPADLDGFAWPGRPTCMVLDVRMPGHNGLDFQERFRAAHPEVPVIFVTGHGDVPMSVRAMKAGAIEFLTKPFREQDLLDAIHAGLAQSREVNARNLGLDDLLVRHASLTVREHEVMGMIIDGLLTKQIAGRLGLSEITVKVCRAALMKKMGTNSLVELGMIAERLRKVHS